MKISIQSLVMDLKRVALGYHRNSLGMANRFYEEAVKRKGEIDLTLLKPYILPHLAKLETLPQLPREDAAEEALLMSILLQNYTQKYL